MSRAHEPGFIELFTPKLITVLREGYNLKTLRADTISGLTVAIIALPLSMAIAIASGVEPERGLYTAIVGGFLVSALGGSRFQIGGPAGAFIVLVLATVQAHGVDGLILATFLSGLFMLAIGLLRLGTFIKYVPYPVTVGFTAGIAVIILASQLKDFLGLTLHSQEPGPLIPKLQVLSAALPTINAAAVALAVASAAIIVVLRRYRPHWPGFLIAVAAATLAAWAFNLPVETIGTRFGGIPQALPLPGLPEMTMEKVTEVLPAALSFALLGSIESLLSAVVADSMTGRRHRSNCELVAQGIANMGSSLFGGFCVTGTIARTASNIRAGAHGPISGMLHSVFLLIFMLAAAPLAAYVPLAALAAILVVVAWNMAEKHQFAALLRASRGDAVVLLVTFLLVIFRDLTEGILAGFGVGALLFLHRMSTAVAVDRAHPIVQPDRADNGERPYSSEMATDDDIVVYRISGAFFFGAAASVAAALDRIGGQPKAYVVDVSAVSVLDSTAAATIEGFARKVGRHDAILYLVGASRQMRHMLHKLGLHAPAVRFYSSMDGAMAAARKRLGR
ncbi:SulP family inorganic anion transporter [Chelativorans sp. SCAU2101]|uniref:SulP family inorganic anion transporter n=1 Tax=Chelativorans petroleitrophicus TaxID=2975484 RepID=A0A9X2X5K0_9HYPH|nr:SulP family inorganic anion transporter [Chelativorans petroleitrophicus]MCT8988953.1 SulP family inorganic anion transporter [Chelativorans petroleitrophicus]